MYIFKLEIPVFDSQRPRKAAVKCLLTKRTRRVKPILFP